MSIDVHIGRHGTAVQDAVAAMYLFGSFRASERKKLLLVAQQDKELFIAALDDFLHRWATADWLEEYNVERVGAWIAKHCSADVLAAVHQHVSRKAPANETNVSRTSVRARTYQAFQKGLGALH